MISPFRTPKTEARRAKPLSHSRIGFRLLQVEINYDSSVHVDVR